MPDYYGKSHIYRSIGRLLQKKVALVCICLIVLIYTFGVLAPFVSSYEYNEQDYTSIREAPSLRHIAGTDLKGRDVFTRVLWGIQNTVIITFITMATGGLLVGVSLGLLAGYFGGRIDAFIMRVGEVFASFPDILLVILLAATLRTRIIKSIYWIEDHTFIEGIVKSGAADYLVISLALISFSWIGMARLVRGQVLFLKENQYIDSAKATGASTLRILFVHLLPNALGPILVTVSMGMGSLIGTEIILSWLGLGIQPPRPSLGNMLLEAGSISALRVVPWMLIAPGIVAWALVLSWNLLGDSLNDIFNPKTK
jgi:ABC-type dipeptide/oligopeptide/nickel transport system permease subunit